MTDNGGTLRGISWRDLCPWLIIFRSFGVSISLPVLMLALVGALITPVGWWISGWVFSNALHENPAVKEIVEANRKCPCRPFFMPTTDDLGSSLLALPGMWHRRFVKPFELLFDVDLTLSGFSCLLLGGLLTLCIWAFFGGAIARIAVVQFGLEERISLKDATTLACRKWGSYVAAPLLPLLGVFVIALVTGSWLGLIMIFNVGSIIGGLLWIFALIGGFVMAVMLLGLVFGWPLMWTTISAEGSDAFDGLSRAYAYVFQRPLHYLFYGSVASIFGLICLILVYLFSEGVIQMTYWSVSWGTNMPELFSSSAESEAGESPSRIRELIAAAERHAGTSTATAADPAPNSAAPPSSVEQAEPSVVAPAEQSAGNDGQPDASESNDSASAGSTPDQSTDQAEPEPGMPATLLIGSWLIYAVNGLVRSLATAFTYSFFWCGMSAVYLLLRRDVDQHEFDEIWIEEDDEIASLPEVGMDESGVPEVTEAPTDKPSDSTGTSETQGPADEDD